MSVIVRKILMKMSHTLNKNEGGNSREVETIVFTCLSSSKGIGVIIVNLMLIRNFF